MSWIITLQVTVNERPYYIFLDAKRRLLSGPPLPTYLLVHVHAISQLSFASSCNDTGERSPGRTTIITWRSLSGRSRRGAAKTSRCPSLSFLIYLTFPVY
jgi:hypothetical protein